MMYCITHEPIEILGFLFEPGIYCGTWLLSPMANIAETIWCEDEDDGMKWFLVHDENHPDGMRPDYTQPVDLKEFFWVKLSAKNWSKISGLDDYEFDESY